MRKLITLLAAGILAAAISGCDPAPQAPAAANATTKPKASTDVTTQTDQPSPDKAKTPDAGQPAPG